jgi:hypothetical protein
MYDTTDGRTEMLKEIGMATTDGVSIYAHKDSITYSDGMSWQYADTP